jgi:hypothetical protein
MSISVSVSRRALWRAANGVIGKSGLKVSKLILGCMQYGSLQDWMIPDHEEGIRQLKYAYDKGINVSLISSPQRRWEVDWR